MSAGQTVDQHMCLLIPMSRLGGVYQAGYFEMSTWIPFVWAIINMLVLILSSFAIYGGL